MSLSMKLLVVLKGGAKNRFGLPVWEVRDRIDLGRIVRFESLQADTEGTRFDPHARAGICVGKMVLDRLFARVKGGLKHEHLAPHFLVYELMKEENAMALAFEHRSKEVVDCGPRDGEFDRLLEIDQGRRHPSRTAMEKHNAFLEMKGDELARLGLSGKYAVLADAPLMWASCREIAHWIDTDIANAAPVSQEMEKSEMAIVRVLAWQKYLQALGDIDARVIIVFPSLDVAE